MSIPRIVNAMEYIDDDLVSGAVTYTRTKKKNSWLKWGAMVACLCLVVVGAFTVPHILKTSAPSKDPTINQPNEMPPVVSNDNAVEVEQMPNTFSSFSEFENAVKKAKASTSDSSVVDDANIGAISYYYAPEKAFEGFELAQIEVLTKRIIMYYIPNSSTSKVFDYDTGIIVTYACEEATTSKNPLAALADQVGMDLTDEGYLYEQERNTITFAAGNSWMSIRVPDDMNDYEQLAPLCVATKNTIK